MSTNIKVAIRIRPLIPSENEKKLPVQWSTQNNVIYQIDETGQRFGDPYSFDHIFGMEKRNIDIYNDIVKDFVVSSLEGLNSTIFAYGQTSSGKTYTMLGGKKDTGLMSLAVENIFNIIENNISRKYLIRVSYIEIYNEKINDLLDLTNKDVKIREFYPATVGLQNVKEEIVSTREQMYDCLKTGTLNRRIGLTKMNDRSSRSHTIFKIIIESAQASDFEGNGSAAVQVSSLNLVDLAGSERVAQTKATGVRLKEGSHINKSLSALGLVIRQLSDGQEFVNFRDSKLTRLLQDSLGGNSKTLIIATITLASVEDTCSTLAFAQRAKAVKNKPHINEILTDADVSKRYASLNSQLQKKLEEQMLINQQLQQTQEQNKKAMTRLQQQMQMLEDFQHGKSDSFDNIPKRRHTIGFTGSKSLLLSDYFKEKNKSNRDVDSCNKMDDFFLQEQSTSPLSTIIEEDTYVPSKFSTPETVLRTRLSVLEQELDELEVFTRYEDNIFNETCKEVDELKKQCQVRDKLLLDYENQIAQFKKREEAFEEEISELKKSAYGPENSCVLDIKEKLIYLQDILSSSNFVNEEDSVLYVVEKFNLKVKTVKEIIGDEILKQINNFDENTQGEILLPNELNSFSELLKELSSFESDIPVELINNMKREGIEDFKILIKIYESLLKKNEFIARCSEKIKMLEERTKEESGLEITSKDEIISEVESLKDKYADCNLDKESEIENLNKKNEAYKKEIEYMKGELEKLKQEISDCCFEKESLTEEVKWLNLKYESCRKEVNDLKLEIESKDKTIAEMEERSSLLKTEFEEIKLEASKNQTCRELDDLKLKIEKLSLEINTKNKTILELETTCSLLKNDLERIKIENTNNRFEKENLQKEMEKCNKELDDLKLQTEKLTSAISSKDKKMTGIENASSKLSEELESLKTRLSKTLSEKETMKNEIEALKMKQKNDSNVSDNIFVLKQEIANKSAEIERLQSDLERLRSEVENHKRNNEMNEQKVDMSKLKSQRQKLLLDNAYIQISEMKESLKEKKLLLSESNKKVEEYHYLNDILKSEIKDLQKQIGEMHVCDKNSEITHENKIRESKNQSIFCSILEYFINEQKAILLIRHPQDQRDHFKSIIKDLKCNNANLKSRINSLRNGEDCGVGGLSEIIVKSHSIFKEYFKLDKSFLESQINQLENSNREYLQEIMALEDLQKNSNNINNECSHCDSLKTELLRLDKLISTQKETIKKLEKENFDCHIQIGSLRNRLYEEQDRKAEIAKTDFMNFLLEDNKMQSEQVKELQKQIEKYQKGAHVNKRSVGVECNLFHSFEQKCRTIENKCAIKEDSLNDEMKKLKSRQILTESVQNENLVNRCCAEVQCCILDTESSLQQKYNLMKKVCALRNKDIALLKAEIAALKSKQ